MIPTFANATAAEVLDRANYTMTVERKETKSGRVSFAHVVTFKGEVFDTRTSGRRYAAFYLNIETGKEVTRDQDGAAYQRQTAARYRAKAAKGGDQFSPEQYLEWAAECDTRAADYDRRAAEQEAKGPAHNWGVYGAGYTNRPASARGVVIHAKDVAQ